MRLAVGVAILLIAALDFHFGHWRGGLFFANLAAGILLTLSVVADVLLPTPDQAGKAQDHADALHPKPK